MITDVRADTRTERKRSRRYWLPLALVVMLVTLFVIEMFSRSSEWAVAGTLQAQADLDGSFNGGALFQAAVLSIAALASVNVAMIDGNRRPARDWMLLSGAFVLLALESLVGRPWLGTATYVAGFFLTMPAMAFLFTQVRSDRVGRSLVGLSLLLILSNVLTEYAKRRIAGSPDNYVFNPATGLYDFTASAWDRLWLISNVQEFSEVAAVICLVAIIGIVADLRTRVSEDVHRPFKEQ